MGCFDGQAHTPINNPTRFLHYECVKSLIIIRFVSWFAIPEVPGVFKGKFIRLLILRHNFYSMNAEKTPQNPICLLFFGFEEVSGAFVGRSITLLLL